MLLPIRKICLLLCAGLALSYSCFAQLSGAYTIGVTPYPTIASIVTALNTSGVSAAVTVNVPAGYTETAPTGGILLGSTALNATLSATNTLTFQKSGTGANPIITAPVGTSTSVDGIFFIAGADYVTINGINLTDANTGSPASMEWGYALVNLNAAAPFDGCQNVTIQNCSITLNRLNTNGAKGIYVSHNVATSSTALTITAPADLHSNNRFYGNTITNCTAGIYLSGYNDLVSPFLLYDQNNDVGGTSAATGNSVTNVGGNAALNMFCIYLANQNAANASYNIINNASGGVGNTTQSIGIYTSGTNSNFTANNNNIVMTNGISTAGTYCIYTANTGTVTVNNNTLQALSTGASTGILVMVYNAGNAISESIQNNNINNCTVNVTGTIYLFYCSNTTPSVNVSGNYITTQFSRPVASANYFYGIFNVGAPTAGTATISNNNLSNITLNNTGIASLSAGIAYAAGGAGTTHDQTISNNTISNIANTGANVFYALYQGGGRTNVLSGNTISNISSGGQVFGIDASSTQGSTVSTLTLSANNINNLSSTVSYVEGIYISTVAPTVSVYRNKIYNLSSGTGGALGINVNTLTAPVSTVYNNLIGQLTATASALDNSVAGLYITGGNVNAYYNSIYLSGTSTASGFGSSGVYANTTNNLTLINNSIINNTVPTGFGLAVAYRRSNATFATYGSASNNNIFYAGTPSATNLIYYDGTNSAQTLAAYQVLAAPRDNNSKTENTAYISTTGSSVDFLKPVPTTPSYSESGGVAIPGYTDDYLANNSRTGYPQPAQVNGGGTAPDIGAYETDHKPVNPLQVTIVTFKGEKQSKDNLLYWSTATETNSAGFDLERADDGKNFTTIATVASKAKGGNSTAPLDYNYIDGNPLKTTNYYRLKQTDLIGRTAYSQVVILKDANDGLQLNSLYPNPVTDVVNLELRADANCDIELTVCNITGKNIMHERKTLVAGVNDVATTVDQLPSGIYMLKISGLNGGQPILKQFVKQ